LMKDREPARVDVWRRASSSARPTASEGERSKDPAKEKTTAPLMDTDSVVLTTTEGHKQGHKPRQRLSVRASHRWMQSWQVSRCGGGGEEKVECSGWLPANHTQANHATGRADTVHQRAVHAEPTPHRRGTAMLNSCSEDVFLTVTQGPNRLSRTLQLAMDSHCMPDACRKGST
jgi:hypothetical protein